MDAGLDIGTLSLPLRKDADGVICVGGSRVGLTTIVDAFREGCSCEEIASQHPAVALTDVYAAVTYYLQHRAEVDAYVASERTADESVRSESERRSDSREFRESLLRRKRATG